MNLALKIVRRTLVAVWLTALLAPAHSDELEDTLQFGNLAAKRGLWSEAAFRWKRVLQLDPNNGRALNNLAVAYEREGKFEEARRYYEAALKASGAPEVRDNFEKFRQFIQQRVAKSTPQTQTQTQTQGPP
jgi:Flp pilus assembly protein TadD